MGLYIAGLRMPKPGTYTKFTVYSDGRVVLHFGGKYIGDAVEVKKPHGRLADVDALSEVIAKMVPWAIDNHIASAFLDGLTEAYGAVKDAPTIIEAEGVE